MANLITHILTVTCSLAKGDKCLEIVDNVFATVFLYASYDVFFSDIWIIGPDLGTRSTMDVLRTVTEHVLVTYVCPNKSVVGLETIDIMKGEESVTQNGETGRGLNAVDRFPLFIGSTRSRDALTSVIAYD